MYRKMSTKNWDTADFCMLGTEIYNGTDASTLLSTISRRKKRAPEILRDSRFYKNQDEETAVRERLRTQESHFGRSGIFNLVPGWEKCIYVLGYCV
jgi:hypothetical protein